MSPNSDPDALCRQLLGQRTPEHVQARKAAQEAKAPATRTSWTVDELLATEFSDPTWIVPGILPAGLASLAGRPKLGKSWLALQLAIAVGSGGRFLDIAMERGFVLYLALEDSPRRLKKRLEMLRARPDISLRFETDWLPLDGEAGGLEDLQRVAARDKPRLIIIDTLARSFTSHVDWNDLGRTTGAMAALQDLALNRDLCILCVDHHRKVGPTAADVIDDIVGSTGKSAVVDTAWGLYRKRGERGATLRIAGRDVDEQELALEFDSLTGCWQLLGDAREVASRSAQEEILGILQSLREADASLVAKEAGLARPTARKHLERLCDQGLAERRQTILAGKVRVLYAAKSPPTAR
ncbi:MAG: AAA family ATPase [Anaerolineae bacterium]|jgi:hypothetical protein|nr:AAA family ATPase [Anaerolineae bacterium]